MTLAMDILPEVAEALAASQPIVALESTIISHGMPYPQNVETAREVEDAVRDEGATPATIAVIDGRLKIGLAPEDLTRLAPAGLRERRATAERSWAAGEISRREQHQMPTEQKKVRADVVLENRGSLEDLRREVERLWARLAPPGASADPRRKT